MSIASQMEFGGDPRWMTFKQASERGMRIKPGSKGNIVEYWQFEKEEEVVGENGEKKKERVKLDSPFVRRSVVFNGQQIEGMPELAPTPKSEIERIELAERIIANSGAVIKFDTPGRAFYTPARDEIHSAPKNAYRSTEDYYSTLLHELGHWTGHADRLDREAYSAALKGHIPKDMYAKEELRAEIASYFLAMDTGIAVTEGHLKNHAAYVASWLEVLKKDKNEIYRAAKDADGICEYLVRGVELEKPAEMPDEYGKNIDGYANTEDTPEPSKVRLILGSLQRAQGTDEVSLAEIDFAKQVDAYLSGKMGKYDFFTVMQTPLVLQISTPEVKTLPMLMTQSVMTKIIKKHNLSCDIIKQLPKNLDDPMLVLKSATREDSIVAVLELQNKNDENIIVPVSLNVSKKDNRGKVIYINDITSVYGKGNEITKKPNYKWFIDQVSAPGRLLYLNQKRFSQWLSLPELQLLGGQSIERSTKTLLQSEHNVNSNERIIKTESDLAKAKGAKVPEKAEVEKNLSQMIDVEKVMEKPPHEWSSADEDAVLKEIDRILAIDRALSHQLKVALDAAPPGSKGEVAENFFAANDKMKPEQERVKRYLLKLKERQELYAETGKEEENRNIGDVDVVMNKGPRRQQMSALMNEGGIIMEKDSVRKTVDIVGKDEIIHYYDKRNKPILGRIIENDSYQVFTSETKSNDITTYHASFYVADKAKGEDGKFPGDARRYCVRVSSTKPFDLSEYRNGEKPIYISGQRFEMTSEKTGKVRDVIIARSITEAERQNDGIWRGVKPIVAKEDSLKNEYQSAAKEVLCGYVYQGKYSQFNKPIMNKENVVISYAQRFTVCAEKWEQGKPVIGENGKRVYELMSVQMYTKEPIEYEKLLSFKDGEKNRITMKGAVHVYDFLNKKNELVKDNKDFEPSWIGAYEKAKDKSLDNKCLEAEEPEL